MSITKTIIPMLEALPEFAGRYSNLKCVNYDVITGVREGVFSIIFEAIDTTSNDKVIIKIFDPDRFDLYRLECFSREAELLEKVISKKRCLQLIKTLDEFQLSLPLSTGINIDVKLKYFVTEHLPISIINEFYSPTAKSNMEVLDKIRIFKQIVLAIAALHRYEIAHRDLKPDNLRAYIEKLKHVVVAIDYGTAVSANQKHIASTYPSSVGATGYASPEALVGLAGDRDIGHLTDYFALGCLFFELFEYDFLFNAIEAANNKRYYSSIQILRSQIDFSQEIKPQWNALLDKFHVIIRYPQFEKRHGIPQAIIGYMNQILFWLIQFDYRKRDSDLDQINRALDICIRIIENETVYLKILAQRKTRKEQQRIKQERIAKTFQNNGVDHV